MNTSIKSVLCILAFAGFVSAQNPNVAAFPSAIATDNTLLVGSDNAISSLSSSITSGATTIPLLNAGNFIAPTALTIGTEKIFCPTLSGNSFTGCTRGWLGTTAVGYAAGILVYENIISYYHNQDAAEIKAIEAALGINFNGGGVGSHGTSYTLLSTDNGTNVLFNGTTLTATLPNPPPGLKWKTTVLNLNSSNLTISPNGLTVNTSGLSITLTQYEWESFWTDGTNYFGITGGLASASLFTSYQFGTQSALTGAGLYLQTLYPGIFSLTQTGSGTSGSPYIDTINLATQSANTGFYGPTTGAASAPTFRAQVIADLPINIPNSNLANPSINVAVPSWLTGTSPVALGGTLTLAAATGQTSHQVIGTCGSATSFAPCSLTLGDLPAIYYQLLGVGGTSQTQRNRLNLIAGSGITITPADNSGTGSTDVTIAATGGGGSSLFTSYQFGTQTPITGNSLYLQTTYPSIFALAQTGSGTSGSPFIDAISLGNEAANSVAAGPVSGGSAAWSFRSLVGADLPNPSSSTLGGIQSLAAVTSKWINTISTSGVPSATQPNFTDLAGTIAIGQTPLTTSQDILFDNAGALGRLGIVTPGNCLGNSGGVWASLTCSGGGGGSTTFTLANAGTTGTTTSTLTKATAGTAVIAATTDTNGILGITTSGAGTSGTATITFAGAVSCVFDGATTANHYVIPSSTTAGNCHDGGVNPPIGVQVIGRVWSTNGGAGTYTIDLFPPSQPPMIAGAGILFSASAAGLTATLDTGYAPVLSTLPAALSISATGSSSGTLVATGIIGSYTNNSYFLLQITDGASHGNDTLNVNGVGPVAIFKMVGTTATAIGAGDIQQDKPTFVRYTSCGIGCSGGSGGSPGFQFTPDGASGGGSSIFTSYQFGTQSALTGTGLYLQTTYPSIFSLAQTGSGTSGSPFIDAISLATQSANLVFAGPGTGSAAAPTFRALVGADLPLPTTSTLGGIESITCPGGEFINAVPTTLTQPTCGTPSGGSGGGAQYQPLVLPVPPDSAAFVVAPRCTTGASPAVCGNYTEGIVAIPAGVNPTLVVQTTAVNAYSVISWSPNSSAALPSTTCNTTLATTTLVPVVTAIVPGFSFTLSFLGTVTTNPDCGAFAIN